MLIAAPHATQSVPVTLREYAIIMPLKLKPGRTTFVLRNLGTFPHNFTAIYGPVKFASGDVDPGRTKRLTVTLVPGVYVIACTVLNGGHLAQGMITRFTIGTREHGSATWHYP
jgi:plastocyanin